MGPSSSTGSLSIDSASTRAEGSPGVRFWIALISLRAVASSPWSSAAITFSGDADAGAADTVSGWLGPCEQAANTKSVASGSERIGREKRRIMH